MFTAINRVIPLWCLIIVFLCPALAAESSWSDKNTTVSIEEYFDLFFSMKFQNLNPAEPVTADFVPNQSKETALLFIARPVVVPDLDLTNDAKKKETITANFQNNITKQASTFINLSSTLLNDSSVSSRWSGATVEKNVAIRFTRSDNVRQTVALTVNGKTLFDPDQIASESKTLKPRAGEQWLE